MDHAGLVGPAREAFLGIQFRAMTQAYAREFPEAERSVLEHGREDAGWMVVHRGVGEIRLVFLAVLVRFRGRGLASEVIRGVQSRAAAVGLPLRLQVFKESRARGLYERLGFRVTGTQDLRVQMEWSEGGAVSQ